MPVGADRLSEQAASCICFSIPFDRLKTRLELGMDRMFSEVTLLSCPVCGQIWLRYHYENEAFTGSGRWYLGAITVEQAASLTSENARATLEGLSWYFYGGSYFQGQTGRSSGVIYL